MGVLLSFIRLLVLALLIDDLESSELLLILEPEPLERVFPLLLLPEEEPCFFTDPLPVLLLLPVLEEGVLRPTSEVRPVFLVPIAVPFLVFVLPVLLILLPELALPVLMLLPVVPLDRTDVLLSFAFTPDLVLESLFVKPELRGPFR